MTNPRPCPDPAKSATRAHADRVAALRSSARTTPLSGVSLIAFSADLTEPGLVGAYVKGMVPWTV
jgi:hypothetical protein